MGLRVGMRISALLLLATAVAGASSSGCAGMLKKAPESVDGGVVSAGSLSTSQRGEPPASHAGPAGLDRLENGLGLTFDRATDGLLSLYEMQGGLVENGLNVEMGRARAGTGLLKVVGPRTNVIQVSVTVPVSGAGKLNSASVNRLQRLLANLAPAWTDRDQWLARAVGGATSMPGTRSQEEREGILFEVTSPRMTEILTLTVRRR